MEFLIICIFTSTSNMCILCVLKELTYRGNLLVHGNSYLTPAITYIGLDLLLYIFKAASNFNIYNSTIFAHFYTRNVMNEICYCFHRKPIDRVCNILFDVICLSFSIATCPFGMISSKVKETDLLLELNLVFEALYYAITSNTFSI